MDLVPTRDCASVELVMKSRLTLTSTLGRDKRHSTDKKCLTRSRETFANPASTYRHLPAFRKHARRRLLRNPFAARANSSESRLDLVCKVMKWSVGPTSLPHPQRKCTVAIAVVGTAARHSNASFALLSKPPMISRGQAPSQVVSLSLGKNAKLAHTCSNVCQYCSVLHVPTHWARKDERHPNAVFKINKFPCAPVLTQHNTKCTNTRSNQPNLN